MDLHGRHNAASMSFLPRNVLVTLLGLGVVSHVAGADFLVTNTNDSGPGSLYQAITDANNTPGADSIVFNIPGAGVHKIDVGHNPLPEVADSLVIDGYSQPGAKPNTVAVGNNAVILIQIDGTGATELVTGIDVLGDSQKSPNAFVIRGLSLTGFDAPDLTPGVTSGPRGSSAISVVAADSAVISGNFIGLAPDGKTGQGNDTGIVCSGNLIIGGTDPAARNVISGNKRGLYGIGVVEGNYIGTDASGRTAVPNGTGIFILGDYSGSSAIIGGTAAGTGNLISGNVEGIHLGAQTEYSSSFFESKGSGVRIKGNLIGLQADGTNALSNQYPIRIEYGSNNIIGGVESGAGNVIAFNDTGIDVSTPYAGHRGTGPDPPSEGNAILSNSIYGNRRVGIDVGSDGPTDNDVFDRDVGPNTYQNKPAMSSEIANGSVTLKGNLNSTPNTQFTLQYFAESLDLLRPVQTYLGSSTITTDDNGEAQFSSAFALTNENVSFNMTATSDAGNTSEFSRGAGRMLNISTRVLVQPGESAAIAGVVIKDSAHLVVRALGPSLQTADGPLPGTLADPRLEVYDSTGKLIAANDNWRDSSFADEPGVGPAPTNDAEAAAAFYVGSGSYTIVVRGAGASSGIALVEAYTIGQAAGEAANISTRGLVQSGDNVMIAGTIIENLGASTRIVARALGPSLSAAGISNPLADPTLELRDFSGTLVASNNDWRDGEADDLTVVGLAPANDKEAALFARVGSGPYTAIVRGQDGSSGVALVELYNLH